MKITVWTEHRLEDMHTEWKPKCIFVGETEVLPRVGEGVVCREGFGTVQVIGVTIDLVTKEAEIIVAMIDRDNEYGPSLI